MTAPESSAYTGPDAAAKALVDELSEVLEEFSEQCAIIGGMAHNFWREPRYTKDVDFTLVADPIVFGKLRERLDAAGYELSRIQNENEPSGPGFARFIQPGTNKIVEFLTAKTEFQVLLIDRAVRLTPEQVLRVATPEDIIVLKLIANRSHDQVDAINLGKIEGLDWDYIERWAAEWSVSERLDTLRAGIAHDRQRLIEVYEGKTPPVA
ncbi:MAG: nucleotidyl transferase AbiEii/AbiGii toxin family protein [Dehalococcoidia bacterium]